MNTNKLERSKKNPDICSLNNLRNIISDIKDPVFIINTEDGTISEANKSALAACKSNCLVGESFYEIVHTEKKSSLSSPVFFNNRWYNIQKDLLDWEGKTYIKVILRQNPSVPDDDTLFTIRKMISVLIHRLRSPLTGMQGYLELIEDVESKSNQRKLGKIDEGLNHIFEMMDELELLHNVKSNVYHKPSKEQTNPETVINEILFDYPADVRNRIELLNPQGHCEFNYNPVELKKILRLLVDNAVEHPSGKNQEVKIHIASTRCIKISNGGKPIPSKITDKLFFPFVTSKVNNMGIGLTFAQLLAARRRAAILLTENSIKNGVSFSFCLPPAVH